MEKIGKNDGYLSNILGLWGFRCSFLVTFVMVLVRIGNVFQPLGTGITTRCCFSVEFEARVLGGVHKDRACDDGDWCVIANFIATW